MIFSFCSTQLCLIKTYWNKRKQRVWFYQINHLQYLETAVCCPRVFVPCRCFIRNNVDIKDCLLSITNATEERLAVSLPAPLSVTVSNFHAGVWRPVSAGREGLENQPNRNNKHVFNKKQVTLLKNNLWLLMSYLCLLEIGSTVSSCRLVNTSVTGVSGAAPQQGELNAAASELPAGVGRAAPQEWFDFVLALLRKTSSLRGRSRQHESRACWGLRQLTARTPSAGSDSVFRLHPPQPSHAGRNLQHCDVRKSD